MDIGVVFQFTNDDIFRWMERNKHFSDLNTFDISQLLYISRGENPEAKTLGGKLITIDELVEQSEVSRRVKLIDQDALVEALRENRIGGVGPDVMTPEPLPLDNPLMKMTN
ncbi:glyoxylate reductase/hydroxypyruvate reductase-like isoform X1, partial [Aphis craccivora]